MALTISIDPSESYLVKNKMITKLATNRYVTAAGTKAKVVLTFSGTGAAVAQSLVFVNTAGTSVTMVFATTLDDSGTKVRTNTLALSLSAFVQQVAEDLQSNYYLQEYYTINYTSSSIIIEAKQVGNDFTTVAFSSATGITVTTMSAGSDYTTEENCKIRMDVFAEDSLYTNIYNKVGTLEEEPFSGFAEFDISTLLRYTFDAADLPGYLETSAIRSKYLLKRYKLVYAEMYGDPVRLKKATTTDPMFCYFAGLSKPEFDSTPLLLDHVWNNKMFLTWQETEKDAFVDVQDYLYFAIPSTAAAFRMKVVVQYTDGTTSTAYPFTRTTINENEVYRIPTGYANLDAIGGIFTVGKVVQYYDIYVDDNAGSPVIIAEKFRYYVNYRTRYNTITLLFNNSFPAMETLVCTGELAIGIQTAEMKAERDDNYTSTVLAAETFKTYTEKLDVFKISTGFQTKERIMQVVDELFLANFVYAAEDEKMMWLPIVINGGSIEKIKSPTQELYAVNFEYAYAFTNAVTTGNITAPDSTIAEVDLPLSTASLTLDSGEPLTLTASI